ncbi:hypothetical protein BSKO_02561 [Bryopsis sp. KO-2023]|nr:hypothetical protein BSKO_02561 [Bryopsis sp. KO-2023]
MGCLFCFGSGRSRRRRKENVEGDLRGKDVHTELGEDSFGLANPHDTIGPFEMKAKSHIMHCGEKQVSDVYRLGGTLGSGGFAVVRMATHKETLTQCACKVMSLPALGAQVTDAENSREDIFREIEILCGLEHKNIVTLQEFFTDATHVYLIFELLGGGELLDAVLERGQYSEADARLCFAQLLEGIAYLHSKGVAHRDLKLENLLLVNRDDITNIKIADFGLAKTAVNACELQTVVGTPQYVAPEVIQGVPGQTYGVGVDMWSAGVVLFILLGGYPPFYHENETKMFDLIRKGGYDFNDPVWDSVSLDAKTLIAQLLVVDPNHRLSASETQNHPWIVGEVSTSPLAATHEKMRKFYQDKWKRAFKILRAVNAFNKLASVSESNQG